MTPFFRRIRQKLANENKFLKYSRYAIGEIVLVVIGILIALSINNWNEERKANAKIDRLLLKVQKELSANISNLTSVINPSELKDSLLYLVNKRLLTSDMLKKNTDPVYAIYSSPQHSIQDEAFKNLMQMDYEFNTIQDSIVTLLRIFYGPQRDTYDKYDDHVEELVISNVKELSKSKEWFTMFFDGKWNEEMSDYFIKDSLFYNDAMMYSILQGGNLSIYMQRMRFNGVNIHRLISKYFNLQDTVLNYQIEDFELYDGVFIDSNSTFEIESKEDRFLFSLKDNGGEESVTEIFPISKTCFTTGWSNGFFYLLLDEKDQVEKLRWSRGYMTKEYLKID